MALMTSLLRRLRRNHKLVKTTLWRKRARLALAALISLQFQTAILSAQQPQTIGKPAAKTAAQTATKAGGPAKSPSSGGQISKLSDAEKSLERARELFADAANAQNNGAYDVAIEIWGKLLKDFPKDPLASSAHHFLGVCHLQKSTPDFNSAIEQFKLALQDNELKQREESMINLGWSLYQRHFQIQGNDAQAPNLDKPIAAPDLEEAVKVLRVVVERYPDGSFLDKALFYLAESQARLGRSDQAIEQYRTLIRNNRLTSSTIRPDAIFGLGITYEEKKQPILAIESYEQFLNEYPKNALANSVRTRLADLALAQNDWPKALKYFEQLAPAAVKAELKNNDYVLYRYGYALAKNSEFEKSAAIYKQLSDLYPESQYSKNSSLASGQALMREKKYDDAVSAFQLLVPLHDDRAAEAVHWICQIKTLQGKLSEVPALAKDALQWGGNSPSAPDLKMDLADGLNSDAATRAEATSLYQQIATDYPEHTIAPRATYNAAFNALQQGALADAQRWSEAFAKRFPSDALSVDIAFIRAESTLQLGQYESAVHAFEQLITSQPTDPMRSTWESRLVVAHYLAGQWPKTIEVANQVLKSDLEPNVKAEVLFMSGAAQLKTGNFDEGIKALESSLLTSSDWAQSGEVSMSLAEAFNNAKSTDKAIKTLEELLARDPNTRHKGQASFRIGQYSAANKDYPRAIAAYDTALASSQETGIREYSTYGKAYALIQQEKYDDALSLLEPITQPSRTDSLGVEAKIAKSICLRQLSRPDEALRVLELMDLKALQADSQVKILYEQSLNLIALKNYEQAISKLNDLSNVTKDNPSVNFQFADKAIYELAWAYKSKGDNTNAAQLFQKLTTAYPESQLAGESYFHLAQVDYDNANYDKAIKAFELALSKTSDPKLVEQSMYKIGWSYFQKGEFEKAANKFVEQVRKFENGPLLIDGKFMVAECYLKLSKFNEAFNEYTALRKIYQQNQSKGVQVGDQVQALTLLHGGQAARELKKWKETEAWTKELVKTYPDSQFRPIALYEQAYALQNQRKNQDAIAIFGEVAENYRNELGARSRFMIGELYFSERDFAKAVAEFQKVMFGFGATQAPAEIKNWQARSAFEAGRCSEVLIGDLTGERKQKAVDTAAKFYEFVVQNHASHELSEKAKSRIAELRK